MVTFTDAMTNLLTFFILLVTFSSFGDDTDAQTGGGGFAPAMGGPTVLTANVPPKDGLLPPMKSPRLRPLDGSELPNATLDPQEEKGKPRAPIGILDAEVHRDRKVIRIPSKYVFYGFGSFVTESGQARLGQIAALLKLHPCQIIIGESSDLHQDNRIFSRRSGNLERAWAVLRYFVDQASLPEDRFRIEASTAVSREAFGGEPVLELVLLTRRVYP
jgi:hypothetical protein